MTADDRLAAAGRRMKVYDGTRSGCTARQLASFLGVSITTVRRDLAAMPSLRGEAASWPDAATWSPRPEATP